MASSSYYFGIVSLVVMLPFVFGSPLASTKFIDDICQHVTDKAFCVETLNASPAASAISEFEAARAALHIGASYAQKSVAFTEKAAKENPNLKKQFLESQNALYLVKMGFIGGASDLKLNPDIANYEVSTCTDNTKLVKYYIGKNRDKASKTIMSMTLMLEKLIAIAVGATETVGG